LAAPSAYDPQKDSGFNLRQTLPSLIFDIALPIVAFNVLTGFGISTLWALVAGGVFPAANIARGWLKSRRLDALGIIVLTFLVLGTAASLISGSVFFALIKESMLTALFGLICLGSLFAARPLMFYVARQFVAGDDAAKLEWWNGLWQAETFRSAMRFVTAMWGIVYLAEALIRVVMAMTLTPGTVVAISPVMAFGITIAMIIWTRRYMLAMRERRLREMQLAQSG
jgi:intracellular septation protein A